jgi:hypothetical protein
VGDTPSKARADERVAGASLFARSVPQPAEWADREAGKAEAFDRSASEVSLFECFTAEQGRGRELTVPGPLFKHILFQRKGEVQRFPQRTFGAHGLCPPSVK